MRLLLEKASLVICLQFTSSDIDLDRDLDAGMDTMYTRSRVYLHLGYVNFSKWTASVLPLYEHATDMCNFESALPAGHKLLQTWGLSGEPGSDDIEECVKEFQTMMQFCLEEVDPCLSCYGQLYAIEESYQTRLAEHEFPSGYVQISAVDDTETDEGCIDDDDDEHPQIGGTLLWRGSERERDARKKRKRGGASQPPKKRAASSAAPSASSCPMPIEDETNDANSGHGFDEFARMEFDEEEEEEEVNLDDDLSDVGEAMEHEPTADNDGAEQSQQDVWDDILNELDAIKREEEAERAEHDSNSGSSSDSDSDSSSSSSTASATGEKHLRRAPPATIHRDLLRSLLPEGEATTECAISRDPASYGYRVLYPHGTWDWKPEQTVTIIHSKLAASQTL